jgi:hypothetical protein
MIDTKKNPKSRPKPTELKKKKEKFTTFLACMQKYYNRFIFFANVCDLCECV